MYPQFFISLALTGIIVIACFKQKVIGWLYSYLGYDYYYFGRYHSIPIEKDFGTCGGKYNITHLYRESHKEHLKISS